MEEKSCNYEEKSTKEIVSVGEKSLRAERQQRGHLVFIQMSSLISCMCNLTNQKSEMGFCDHFL